jgi:hypothetical protein
MGWSPRTIFEDLVPIVATERDQEVVAAGQPLHAALAAFLARNRWYARSDHAPVEVIIADVIEVPGSAASTRGAGDVAGALVLL